MRYGSDLSLTTEFYMSGIKMNAYRVPHDWVSMRLAMNSELETPRSIYMTGAKSDRTKQNDTGALHNLRAAAWLTKK